jgi:hypothetical protein
VGCDAGLPCKGTEMWSGRTNPLLAGTRDHGRGAGTRCEISVALGRGEPTQLAQGMISDLGTSTGSHALCGQAGDGWDVQPSHVASRTFELVTISTCSRLWRRMFLSSLVACGPCFTPGLFVATASLPCHAAFVFMVRSSCRP